MQHNTSKEQHTSLRYMVNASFLSLSNPPCHAQGDPGPTYYHPRNQDPKIDTQMTLRTENDRPSSLDLRIGQIRLDSATTTTAKVDSLTV